jgi:hypothetical protein
MVWLYRPAYPSGEEGGNFFVQISTCLRYTLRKGGGGGSAPCGWIPLLISFIAEFNLFNLIILLASGLSELHVRPLRRSSSANTDGRRGESPLRFSSHLFNQNVARLHSTTGPLASSGGYHIYLSRDEILGHQFNNRLESFLLNAIHSSF